MTGHLSRVTALCCSAAVALGLAELAARTIAPPASTVRFEPHPIVGVAHVPGQRVWVANEAGEFGAWFTTNAYGDPDVERPRRKPPGVTRVAVVGDSMVEASQVAPAARFTTRLEQHLTTACAATASSPRVIEVLNFGVAAFGTAQEWLYYRSHIRHFDPDVVVVVVFPDNDVMNNSVHLEVERAGRPEQRPFFRLTPSGSLVVKDHRFYRVAQSRHRASRARAARAGFIDESQLVTMARRASARLRGVVRSRRDGSPVADDQHRRLQTRLEGFDQRAQDTPVWQEAWRTTSALLTAFARSVRQDGAQFEVAVLPGPWGVYGGPSLTPTTARYYDWARPTATVESLARGLDIHTTGLRPALLSAAEASDAPLFFPVDGHLTPRGHQVVATVLGHTLRPTLSCSQDVVAAR